MSAHDVIYLRCCRQCGELEDSRHMIELSSHPGEFSHGHCFIEFFGLNELLKLPVEKIAGLTLADVGSDVMSKILDKHF